MIWFTADQHYGHANIIRHCKRPYEDAPQMDAELIRRHNECVGDNDTVYVLGDFAWKVGPLPYLKRMRGRFFFFLPGSHDRHLHRWFGGLSSRQTDDAQYHWCLPLLTIDCDLSELQQPGSSSKTAKRRSITLCHYAMRSWPRSHHGSWHLHGHSHGKLPPHGLSFDVGVDTHDFRPWSLAEVTAQMEQLESGLDRDDTAHGVCESES